MNILKTLKGSSKFFLMYRPETRNKKKQCSISTYRSCWFKLTKFTSKITLVSIIACVFCAEYINNPEVIYNFTIKTWTIPLNRLCLHLFLQTHQHPVEQTSNSKCQADLGAKCQRGLQNQSAFTAITACKQEICALHSF